MKLFIYAFHNRGVRYESWMSFLSRSEPGNNIFYKLFLTLTKLTKVIISKMEFCESLHNKPFCEIGVSKCCESDSDIPVIIHLFIYLLVYLPLITM